MAAMVGLVNRSTMDMDATIKNFPMTEDVARNIVEEISSIQIDDGMTFEIKSINVIMSESDYQGLRVILDASLEKMHTPLKIDFSTGDIITPKETEFQYQTMFEGNTISILAYNLETILAEKIETLISRGITNSRMRDFYDIYILGKTHGHQMNLNVLHDAIYNTSKKRGSTNILKDTALILEEIYRSNKMISL